MIRFRTIREDQFGKETQATHNNKTANVSILLDQAPGHGRTRIIATVQIDGAVVKTWNAPAKALPAEVIYRGEGIARQHLNAQ